MLSTKFSCHSCGVEGVIKFNDDEQSYTIADVAYCPFCAHDIQENSFDLDDEEDLDSEDV